MNRNIQKAFITELKTRTREFRLFAGWVTEGKLLSCRSRLVGHVRGLVRTKIEWTETRGLFMIFIRKSVKGIKRDTVRRPPPPPTFFKINICGKLGLLFGRQLQ